jgi:molybdate transport system regulatory protein
MKASMNIKARIRVQIMCGDEIALGPGKADLLEAIDRDGSISAAGRSLGMSYRRTWQLVDTMNRCWRERPIETLRGGGRERGARLTVFGRRLVERYRQMEVVIANAAAPDLSALAADIRNHPLAKVDADASPDLKAQ